MRRMSRVLAAALAIAAGALAGSTAAQARDLAAMNADEIRLLQRRLADAGCYKGAMDGKGSADIEAAIKACPDQEPKLVIETGMHTAAIPRIGVDAACTLLATGSEDKTVRLVDLLTGQFRQTIRMPIDTGFGGRINAVALSPNAKVLAAGGWDAAYESTQKHAVYITDLTDGSVRRIGGFERGIGSISFSPEGRLIAVSLGGNNGIRVFEVGSGQEVMADRDFADNSYSVIFLPDGGLAATSYDGFVRLYGSNLQRKAKVATGPGARPYGIAISPDGRTIAVGYADAPRISLFDARDLKLRRHIENGDIDNSKNLHSLTFTRDGQLWAGGAQKAKTGSIFYVASLLKGNVSDPTW